MPREIYLVDGRRTPLARTGGRLRLVPPEGLAAPVLKGVAGELDLEKSQLSGIILGNAVGLGGNIARLSLLTAGLPLTVPGLTIDLQCGSGLEAINLAARSVLAGDGDLYLAGGSESISQEPLRFRRPPVPSSLTDINSHPDRLQLIRRPPFAPAHLGDPDMGEAAELVAERYCISRQEQDAWALRSYSLASRAADSGFFRRFIVPVESSDGSIVTVDDQVRQVTPQLLKRLPPAFKAKAIQTQGSVTAGNSCRQSDGAAAVLVASSQGLKKINKAPMARFMAAAVVGLDPNLPGLGPVPAVHQVLGKTGLKLIDIDLVEINEAFASQVLACLKELGLPGEKVNVNGGAIAFGHPYGATGAILMLHLMYELAHRHLRYGLVAMGIGGGLGVATLVEALI